MEWIFSIFSTIFSFFFGEENSDGERDGGLVGSLWDGAKSVGGGIYDWFASDEVSLGTKATAALGAAYLLAPDATTKVISNAADGIANTAGNVAGSTVSVAAGFLSKWWPYLLLGLGVYLLVSDDD